MKIENICIFAWIAQAFLGATKETTFLNLEKEGFYDVWCVYTTLALSLRINGTCKQMWSGDLIH